MPKTFALFIGGALLATLGCSCGPPAYSRCGTEIPNAQDELEAVRARCEQLERDADALLAQYNECSSDDDCMFVRDEAGCVDAFACAVPVNKAHAETFTPLATELSRTYHAQCGRCVRMVAECQVVASACTQGRCAVRWDP